MRTSKKLSLQEKSEINDLSELNMFDAMKHIVLICTNSFKTSPDKKLKFKVASANMQNLLNELPISNMIEIV